MVCCVAARGKIVGCLPQLSLPSSTCLNLLFLPWSASLFWSNTLIHLCAGETFRNLISRMKIDFQQVVALPHILHQTIISSIFLVWISCERAGCIWLDYLLWFWLVNLASGIVILKCDANSRSPAWKSLKFVQGGRPIWRECWGLYLNWCRRLVKLLVILGCVHLWIRRLGYQWPTSEDCSRLHPQAAKSDRLFIFLCRMTCELFLFTSLSKKIGNEKGSTFINNQQLICAAWFSLDFIFDFMHTAYCLMVALVGKHLMSIDEQCQDLSCQTILTKRPRFFTLTQPRGWGWGRRWARGNYRLS